MRYLILTKSEHGSKWSEHSVYSDIKTAEKMALEILKTEHPIDILIVKDLKLTIKVSME